MLCPYSNRRRITMEKNPVTLKCKDCGAEFEVSVGEQDWYAKKGWELPKRCKDCRAVARTKRKKEEEK
jgi:Zn finger protein HypA/HybF involved in hydrogenase expression